MPIGRAAAVLRPLVDSYGEALVRANLQRFLRAYQGSEARFLSLEKFGETFGAWSERATAIPGKERGSRSAAEASMDNMRRLLAEVEE